MRNMRQYVRLSHFYPFGVQDKVIDPAVGIPPTAVWVGQVMVALLAGTLAPGGNLAL